MCKVQALWEGHKIWKNLPPVLTKQLFLLITSKQVGDFFQIFVAFSKKLDFNMDHVARGAKYGNFGVLYEKEIIIRL